MVVLLFSGVLHHLQVFYSQYLLCYCKNYALIFSRIFDMWPRSATKNSFWFIVMQCISKIQNAKCKQNNRNNNTHHHNTQCIIHNNPIIQKFDKISCTVFPILYVFPSRLVYWNETDYCAIMKNTFSCDGSNYVLMSHAADYISEPL